MAWTIGVMSGFPVAEDASARPTTVPDRVDCRQRTLVISRRVALLIVILIPGDRTAASVPTCPHRKAEQGYLFLEVMRLIQSA